MLESGDRRVAERTECHSPKRFKNKAGLNGHTQCKHGRLHDGRDALRNGKQSQMYQDLMDRVNQVLGRQDDIFDHLKNGLANGNGDGYSNEPIGITSPPPAGPTTYSHQGCGTPLEKLQRYCGGCGQEIESADLPYEPSPEAPDKLKMLWFN